MLEILPTLSKMDQVEMRSSLSTSLSGFTHHHHTPNIPQLAIFHAQSLYHNADLGIGNVDL